MTAQTPAPQKPSNTALTQRAQEVAGMLKENMRAIQSVLPKHITPERMLRIAHNAISRNPKLLQCTEASLVNAIIEASVLGLEIGDKRGLCSLSPFWNKHINSYEAQLMVQYQGKIALAYRSPQVSHFSGHAVFEKDKFEYKYGTSPSLNHEPYSGKDGRGELIAAYAIICYKDGGQDFEVIHYEDAMNAKKRSPSKDKRDSPWNSKMDEPAMWIKTAVHRLAKRAPQCPDLHLAAQFETAQSIGEYGGLSQLNQDLDLPTPKSISDDINNEINGKEDDAETNLESNPGQDPNQKKSHAPGAYSTQDFDNMSDEALKERLENIRKNDKDGKYDQALMDAGFSNTPTAASSMKKVLAAYYNKIG